MRHAGPDRSGVISWGGGDRGISSCCGASGRSSSGSSDRGSWGWLSGFVTTDYPLLCYCTVFLPLSKLSSNRLTNHFHTLLYIVSIEPASELLVHKFKFSPLMLVLHHRILQSSDTFYSNLYSIPWCKPPHPGRSPG